jgi:hypothetical protein
VPEPSRVPAWIAGLGGSLLLGLAPLVVIIIVAMVRHWREGRWRALSHLACLVLGLGLVWFVPGKVHAYRQRAFEKVLPEYERAIHSALGAETPTRAAIDPHTLPRPGDYCCLRIWARRDADGRVSGTLLVTRSTIYVYGDSPVLKDSSAYIRQVADQWWLVHH